MMLRNMMLYKVILSSGHCGVRWTEGQGMTITTLYNSEAVTDEVERRGLIDRLFDIEEDAAGNLFLRRPGERQVLRIPAQHVAMAIYLRDLLPDEEELFKASRLPLTEEEEEEMRNRNAV